MDVRLSTLDASGRIQRIGAEVEDGDVIDIAAALVHEVLFKVLSLSEAGALVGQILEDATTTASGVKTEHKPHPDHHPDAAQAHHHAAASTVQKAHLNRQNTKSAAAKSIGYSGSSSGQVVNEKFNLLVAISMSSEGLVDVKLSA